MAYPAHHDFKFQAEESVMVAFPCVDCKSLAGVALHYHVCHGGDFLKIGSRE